MPVKEKEDRYMHGRLPIGKDEKILAIYKHHWFSYAAIWAVGLLVIAVVMGIAVLLTTVMAGDNSALAERKSLILSGALVFSVLVAIFTFIPVYLKAQEQVVLTEEALLQILQPTIFASKISQLNLLHMADVSVRQDFFGTVFDFGKISVETPGEQDNYEFFAIPHPKDAAKTIIEAHENYQAALESGRLPTTLGTQPAAQQIQVDPAQYQQFLAYQQSVAQNGQPAAQPQPPTVQPPQPPAENGPAPQQPGYLPTTGRDDRPD
jgi:hypothetical protein